MKRQMVRLTESDLHRIIKESVNRVLNEIGDTPRGQEKLGAVAKRASDRMMKSLEDGDPNDFRDFRKYKHVHDDAVNKHKESIKKNRNQKKGLEGWAKGLGLRN